MFSPQFELNDVFVITHLDYKTSSSDGGRSRLKNEIAHLDQQGGGSRYIGGSGNVKHLSDGCVNELACQKAASAF